jgi:uncharacterized protein YjdB
MTGRHTLRIAVVTGGVACLIATTVISCSEGNRATPTSPTAATATTVASVVVSASATSLTVGASATVSAMATHSDGTSAEVTPMWGSSAPGVATVSASGTVTAIASGTTTITGAFSGQHDSVTITVTAPEITSLSVSASATSLTVGASATVSAMATHSDGTSAEVTPTWGSSAPGVATVSALGTVTAIAVGTATITGAFSGQHDSVTITVTAPEITSLSVSASATFLTVGASATATAIATYSDGTSAEIIPTWGSSAPGTAKVHGPGTVTAIAVGTATITGTFSGQHDSVVITVTAPNADDILARCPTPSEVAVSDLDLSLVFESDPTAGQIVCSAAQSSRDLTLLQAQVYRVLTIMRHLEFDAPLPWTPNSLYGWMVSSINGIRLRGDIGISFCCSPANTINIQTQNNASLTFPTEFRWVAGMLVLFVHEARHNNGKPHTCGSSDNTIDELGAWGVQYYTYLFLGSHSDPAFITPADRSEFMSRAQQTCSARFCQDNCP